VSDFDTCTNFAFSLETTKSESLPMPLAGT
jgi:hypothetical protein